MHARPVDGSPFLNFSIVRFLRFLGSDLLTGTQQSLKICMET